MPNSESITWVNFHHRSSLLGKPPPTPRGSHQGRRAESTGISACSPRHCVWTAPLGFPELQVSGDCQYQRGILGAQQFPTYALLALWADPVPTVSWVAKPRHCLEPHRFGAGTLSYSGGRQPRARVTNWNGWLKASFSLVLETVPHSYSPAPLPRRADHNAKPLSSAGGAAPKAESGTARIEDQQGLHPKRIDDLVRPQAERSLRTGEAKLP